MGNSGEGRGLQLEKEILHTMQFLDTHIVLWGSYPSHEEGKLDSMDLIIRVSLQLVLGE